MMESRGLPFGLIGFKRSPNPAGCDVSRVGGCDGFSGRVLTVASTLVSVLIVTLAVALPLVVGDGDFVFLPAS